MENTWYAGMGGAALGPRSTSVFQHICLSFSGTSCVLQHHFTEEFYKPEESFILPGTLWLQA